MPQIWMTYDEIAGLLECSADEALERARSDRLDRKQSRDGRTRVKLNLALIGLFIDRIRSQAQPLDQAIQDMRQVHGLMKSYEPDQEQAAGAPKRPFSATG